MENSENGPDSQSEEYQKRLQDAFLCTEILKKVLELRPMIREGIVGTSGSICPETKKFRKC